VNENVATLKASGTLPAGKCCHGMIMKKIMEVVGSRSDGKSIQEAVKKALQ